jgi:hypothetical protein
MESTVVCYENPLWGERVCGYTACIAAGQVAELAVVLQKCYVISMIEARFGWAAAVHRQKADAICYRMEA